jgi:hypothetical protein
MAGQRATDIVSGSLHQPARHPDVQKGSMMFTVRFVPNAKGPPPGKLADAEINFNEGPLAGLKLIGFAIWERRGGGRNLTFPARQYSVNGERRSFALLRPIADAAAQDSMRDMILSEYAEFEQEQEAPVV